MKERDDNLQMIYFHQLVFATDGRGLNIAIFQ